MRRIQKTQSTERNNIAFGAAGDIDKTQTSNYSKSIVCNKMDKNPQWNDELRFVLPELSPIANSDRGRNLKEIQKTQSTEDHIIPPKGVSDEKNTKLLVDTKLSSKMEQPTQEIDELVLRHI
ncbi:hypothetical protein DICVIV_02522 [Dictyocaulus viviparus]|uniref:Uncharacterized protein n=1 Tax=Dictyocaulus viviparus TaxID=29172 RepID=A0A0D8Y5R0_DICVI|nr:hypothetical protein DICVIV_02522 [Dictyocaulus viviparus]